MLKKISDFWHLAGWILIVKLIGHLQERNAFTIILKRQFAERKELILYLDILGLLYLLFEPIELIGSKGDLNVLGLK